DCLRRCGRPTHPGGAFSALHCLYGLSLAATSADLQLQHKRDRGCFGCAPSVQQTAKVDDTRSGSPAESSPIIAELREVALVPQPGLERLLDDVLLRVELLTRELPLERSTLERPGDLGAEPNG